MKIQKSAASDWRTECLGKFNPGLVASSFVYSSLSIEFTYRIGIQMAAHSRENIVFHVNNTPIFLFEKYTIEEVSLDVVAGNGLAGSRSC